MNVALLKYCVAHKCDPTGISDHRHMNVFSELLDWGLNVALTDQNRSYRNSETKENVEAQKRKQRGGNDSVN